uniref:Serine--tRNA ligase n=1 Tax=candidate division WOR-3 bacterium TaxID=2052148 RepID=A0A7V3VUV3_UNCW3
MVDIKILRENPEIMRQSLKNRGIEFDLDKLLEIDKKRRNLITEIDKLRKERNLLSEQVGRLKREKKEPQELMERARIVGEQIKVFEEEMKEVEKKFNELMLLLPNIPHPSVPVGKESKDNKFIRGLKEPPEYPFKPIPHWEICEALDMLDIKRAPKISASRFILYKGLGARLERALINFFLDLHTKKHGYKEIFPPVLNNPDCFIGTGQLPRLESEMYKCRDDELYLIPTAEVPLTNIHRDEIIPEKELPIYYVAYTPCFRREAGSYGKEIRGITRVHQFNKVELVKYTTPETGYEEFEKLLNDAEEAVKLLGLPYRIMLLCTGDMTFASAKTYDIEVYAPGMGEWLEVSSVSCYEQYQARRAMIRYRKLTGGVDYVWTINGSGLATPRTFIGIVENYQTQDGRIRIPDVLKPYMDNLEYIG